MALRMYTLHLFKGYENFNTYFIIKNCKSHAPMCSFVFVYLVFIELVKLWILLNKQKITFMFTKNILIWLKNSI